MFYIGCHLSPSAGLRSMGETALSIGATTLQFFTRNPRGSKAKPIDPADAAALLALWKTASARWWLTPPTPSTLAPGTNAPASSPA